MRYNDIGEIPRGQEKVINILMKERTKFPTMEKEYDIKYGNIKGDDQNRCCKGRDDSGTYFKDEILEYYYYREACNGCGGYYQQDRRGCDRKMKKKIEEPILGILSKDTEYFLLRKMKENKKKLVYELHFVIRGL